MTSWPSESTLQRLLDLAGLHYITSERSGPFWQSMLHNFLSRPLSFLGWTTVMFFWLDFHQTQSNLYKWFRMQRHDWSSTNLKEPMLHLSLSPCTGYQLHPFQKPHLLPLTITNLHPLQKPLLLSLTITNLHPLQMPRLLPLTITNLHPLQKPRLVPLTITNLHPLQKPRLLQLTITNLHPLQKPRLLPLTITNPHPLQKPRLLPLTITNLHLVI